MNLTFLGAAREVTGSCYLLESGRSRLLVDCGLFQGGREARAKNLSAFSFTPATIDCVILSHAHIDHSGLLPRLTALGFKGPIFATPATCDLLGVMLPDAAHIQEKEAEHENYQRFRSRSAGEKRLFAPLYTVEQARNCLKHLHPVDYDQPFQPLPGIICRFRDAGHILGSAIVEITLTFDGQRRSIVFSGDLGQPMRPLVRDPTPIEQADWLVVESTYGNRLHKSMPETEDELVQAVIDTLEHRGGNLVVPAFAVGRTQDMLYLLADLTRRRRIPKLEVYVDSPMAMAATEITYKHMALLDEESQALMRRHGGAPWFRKLAFVESVDESIALDKIEGGIVIISASG
ncbi:MAG: MBL fold metallo-hydrolase, partial [Rhodocyclaceae bacterium]